jgi:hypothetical protein
MRQGCQMVYLRTKKSKFWVNFREPWNKKLLEYVFYCHLVYFKGSCYISWLFGIFHGYLVYFLAIWNILRFFGTFCDHYGMYFSGFGMLYPEKSGNPGLARLL